MHPTEQLAYILPTLSATVDRIDPDQLHDPTPCERFEMTDILDHMLTLGGAFGFWFRGEEPPEATPPVRNGEVPAEEFRAVMDALLAAVKSPGAMERVISTPMGEMPGETFARLVAFDGLVHGWDIATAMGTTFEVPAVVVGAVADFAATALTDEMRDGETFKLATEPPAGADALDRLAAFSGRTVPGN